MAMPRGTGEALTYAGVYALFSLVGIAGEDDLAIPAETADTPGRVALLVSHTPAE
jgi:hypothetical protein